MQISEIERDGNQLPLLLSPSSDDIISATISIPLNNKTETPNTNANPDTNNSVGTIVTASDADNDANTSAAAGKRVSKKRDP